MKLAISMLCENPQRKTGLTTLFHELVSRSLRLFPDVAWLVFVGPNQEWTVHDPRVTVNREFPANDRLKERLIADHLRVPVAARRAGADALITTGFVPLRKLQPAVMQVFSLQHLGKSGFSLAREAYRRFVTRVTWPKADLVITNSKFAQSQIVAVFPRLAGRIVQSYEGLQHEQFTPSAAPQEASELERQFGLKPGYFLSISNFYPYKQCDLLIEGYARLRPEMRAARPLVLVGGDWENTLAQLKARAQALGIESNVRFPGWVEDRWLSPLYRHAGAFCLSSREETFGRSVIEAMACGTPTIVNDIPIMREVTAGQAEVVDFSNPNAVSRAMERIAGDSAAARHLIAGGLARAMEFSFERLATERIGAIRALLQQKKQ